MINAYKPLFAELFGFTAEYCESMRWSDWVRYRSYVDDRTKRG